MSTYLFRVQIIFWSARGKLCKRKLADTPIMPTEDELSKYIENALRKFKMVQKSEYRIIIAKYTIEGGITIEANLLTNIIYQNT